MHGEHKRVRRRRGLQRTIVAACGQQARVALLGSLVWPARIGRRQGEPGRVQRAAQLGATERAARVPLEVDRAFLLLLLGARAAAVREHDAGRLTKGPCRRPA